jgi:signal transduction histidine kinase/CheY-like chemotaxis protein
MSGAATDIEDFLELVCRAPVGLVRFDDQGTVDLVNPAACNMIAPLMESPSIDNIFVSLRDVCPDLPETIANFEPAYGPVFEGRRIACRVPKGKRTLALTVHRLHRNSHMATLQDVTRQQEAEEQLRQLQKLEVIGRLTAGVCHDFNNLLQAIMGGAEFLRDEPALSTDAAEWLDLIESGARRGAYLTHHMLSYSRQQALAPKDLDLAGIMESFGLLVERTLGSVIAFSASMADGIGFVRADPGLLETALMNLAINAAHAMPDGGSLTCEAVPVLLDQPFGELKPGRYAMIAVTDSGTGMAPDVLARAFDPFFTTKGPDGTGLGLSMVQGFCRQSGGDVRVFSTAGKGTRFEIWLPEVPRNVEPADIQARPVAARTGRVLVVDDSLDVLRLMDAYLRTTGLTVRQATGGMQALAVMEAGERFDLLITDYAMPRLNGVALLRQARAIQPDLRALFISGFVGVSDALAGVTDAALLFKPFQRSQLTAAIDKLLVRQDEAAG